MTNLLIDIGNSCIKTALSKENKLFNVKRYNYSQNNFPNIVNNILKYKKGEFGCIGISCLNKKYKNILVKISKQKYSIKPFFIEFDNNFPIKINYEKSLGNDRICSVTAAYMKYKDKINILVIDFGTATTYNLISDKVFIGGLITPGIITSLESLKTKANLPLTDLKNITKLIYNKTKLNILSGVIHQSLFTTDAIINELKKKYENLYVICTGGLAELIFKKNCLISKVEKNLVLEGINFILIHNLKTN
jgi:type III pantothenate kinase